MKPTTLTNQQIISNINVIFATMNLNQRKESTSTRDLSTRKFQRWTQSPQMNIEHSSAHPSKTCFKPRINCIRNGDGCKNLVNDYFDRFSAMCSDCIQLMDSIQKSSCFSSTLCPCCHELSGGYSFSLCSTCLEYLFKEGFTESEWGAWVLDRNYDKIICVQLDSWTQIM